MMSSLISSVSRLPERWRAALPLGPWLGARPAHAVTTVSVGERCALARVERAEGPGGWRVTQAAEGSADALAGWRTQGWFDGSTPVLVLGAPDRHFLTLDRPPVPDDELALAVRYPLAEASDTEPEQLLTCAVPLPRINEALKPQVLAVAGRLDAAREQLGVLSAAGIKVRSIDVGYTALRGMALMQPEDSDEDEGWIAVALIGNDICIGLIWHGQFCALRTLALPTRLPRDELEFGEQLALHIQRTTDLFERQATQLSVRHALVSLPTLSRAAREAVHESLTLSPVPFDIESQIDMSDDAREVCLAHRDLSTLVCVAAARLHDSGGRAQVVQAVAEPEGIEA